MSEEVKKLMHGSFEYIGVHHTNHDSQELVSVIIYLINLLNDCEGATEADLQQVSDYVDCLIVRGRFS